MSDLGGVLGQDRIASEISERLQREPRARVVRLTGPSGSGKTQIALMVGSAWQKDRGRCVIALGDDNHSTRPLYPFLSGLSSVPHNWAAIARSTRSAVQVADVVVGARGGATSIFDLLTSAFRQRTERALRPFSTAERDIALDLKRLARTRPLLLIAENAHWWDSDSLWLLAELMSDRLRAGIPHLNALSVLVVDANAEQGNSASKPFHDLVRLSKDHQWELSRCTPAEFPEVLASLGMTQDLPADVVDALYSATGGHLKLAEQIVAYAELHSLDHLVGPSEHDYIATLLAARLESLGTESDLMRELLVRAAVIGLSFEEKELLCLGQGLDSDLLELIDRAERISFLRRWEGRLSFAHDAVRAAFVSDQTPSQVSAHRKRFAECLAILRPGDYRARAELLLLAGEAERGRELFAVAGVESLRRGMPASRVLREAEQRFPGDGHLLAYLGVMAAGYEAVATGSYRSQLPQLKTPLRGESHLMAAQRNYLVALCLMELQAAEGFAEAQETLASWQPTVEHEPEASSRFLLLLQQAQVLGERFEDARETERTIERSLLRRARYDPDAAAMLQIQNRRSAALNVPEIAELRIHEAVRFFRQDAGDPARDPVELYRSLTNLAAIQIRVGKNADAYATCLEAQALVLDTPETTPRIDVLANNTALAGFRSGAFTLAEAITAQTMAIESVEGADDKFIHRCNLIAYLLLAGDDERGRVELAHLEDLLRGDDLLETYLVYYWRALDVAAAALGGRVYDALEKHDAMVSFVDTLRWPSAPYVRRRQTLLGDVLRNLRPDADRIAADVALLDARPVEIGPAWSYYARLVPCCELSFWSDS